MSWGGNENGDQLNAYYKPRSGELGHVRRPVIIDHNGVQRQIVGFDYESRKSQQFVGRTEKVLTYIRFPGMAEEEYIPSRTEGYGTGDLSGRKDEFSSRSYDKRTRGPIKDSPWDRFDRSPSKDHRHTTSDDEDEHHKFHNVHANNPKGTRTNNLRDKEYYDDDKNQSNGFTEPWSRQNYLKDHHDDDKNQSNGFTEPWSRQNYLKDHHDDDKNQSNGFTEPWSRQNYHKDHQDYYEHANPKTNGYSPPKGSLDHKNMGKDYATQAPMGPFATPPRNETSYETSNFKPVANGPPWFNPQPKKEQRNYNQENIDSTVARGQTGMAVPRDKYSGGVIDCRQAAEMYKGVLLTK